MAVRFQNIVNLNTKDLNFLCESLYNLISDEPINKDSKYKFQTISKPSPALFEGDALNIDAVIKSVVQERDKNLIGTLTNKFFIGGFNLKGMPITDIHNFINNVLLTNCDTEKSEDYIWYMLQEDISKFWCEKLKIEHQNIYVTFFVDPFQYEREMEELLREAEEKSVK